MSLTFFGKILLSPNLRQSPENPQKRQLKILIHANGISPKTVAHMPPNGQRENPQGDDSLGLVHGVA
jgi:ribosome maturation protein Sdo1